MPDDGRMQDGRPAPDGDGAQDGRMAPGDDRAHGGPATPDGDRTHNGRMTRRGFLAVTGRTASALALGGTVASLAAREPDERMVWQIDPFKCVQCGRCQTECVLEVSAVKCVHDFSMCGYCKFCFGFFRTDAVELTEAAENQLCPTGALVRTYVEEPYYQYTVDEDLCVGCARCVEGCEAFGNGSLYLQVRHDRCLNCSECAIAMACPADAYVRLPAATPYFVKHLGPGQFPGVYRMG